MQDENEVARRACASGLHYAFGGCRLLNLKPAFSDAQACSQPSPCVHLAGMRRMTWIQQCARK